MVKVSSGFVSNSSSTSYTVLIPPDMHQKVTVATIRRAWAKACPKRPPPEPKHILRVRRGLQIIASGDTYDGSGYMFNVILQLVSKYMLSTQDTHNGSDDNSIAGVTKERALQLLNLPDLRKAHLRTPPPPLYDRFFQETFSETPPWTEDDAVPVLTPAKRPRVSRTTGRTPAARAAAAATATSNTTTTSCSCTTPTSAPTQPQHSEPTPTPTHSTTSSTTNSATSSTTKSASNTTSPSKAP
ncbi:hypothetical protein Pelo_16613 [Pelomyxa schiedti]|nr:hypothetical protein Pelo_16613 [Pelomyxa schiedti]